MVLASTDPSVYFVLMGTGLFMATIAIVGNTLVGRRLGMDQPEVGVGHGEPPPLRQAWYAVRRVGRATIVSGLLAAVVEAYAYSTDMTAARAMWMFTALSAIPIPFVVGAAYGLNKVFAEQAESPAVSA